MSPLKIVIMLLLLEKSGVSGSSSSSIKSRMMAHDSVPNMGSLTSFSAKSLVQCSAACHRREECKSFAYHKENSDCFLYSEKATSNISSRKGYKYYADGDQLTARFVPFNLTNYNFADSQENCLKKFNGHLAYIQSEEDQLVINKVIGGIKNCEGYWIGLEWHEDDSVFKWLNGKIHDKAKSYQNWDDGYPRGVLTIYGVGVGVFPNGIWRNIAKNIPGCSVCEIPA